MPAEEPVAIHGHGRRVRPFPWRSSSRRIIYTFTWKSNKYSKRFLVRNHPFCAALDLHFSWLIHGFEAYFLLQNNQPRKLWIRCATSSRCWPRFTDGKPPEFWTENHLNASKQHAPWPTVGKNMMPHHAAFFAAGIQTEGLDNWMFPKFLLRNTRPSMWE